MISPAVHAALQQQLLSLQPEPDVIDGGFPIRDAIPAGPSPSQQAHNLLAAIAGILLYLQPGEDVTVTRCPDDDPNQFTVQFPVRP